MAENMERAQRFFNDLRAGVEVIIGDLHGSIRMKVTSTLYSKNGYKRTLIIRGPIAFGRKQEPLLGDFTYEVKGDEHILQILKLIDY